MGEALPRNYNLIRGSETPLPSLQLALGNRWQWGSFLVGTLASFNYNNSLESEDRTTAQVDVAGASNSLAITERGQLRESVTERRISATWDLGLEIQEEHQVRATVIALQHSTDTTAIQEVSGSGVNDFARRRTRTEWVERGLLIQQVKGSHRLAGSKQNPLQLEWRAGLSQAHRQAPDMKEYTYRKLSSSDSYRLDPEVSGNLRTFGELDETSSEWGLELKKTISSESWGLLSFRAGVSDLRRERQSDTFRLQFVKNYLAGDEPDLSRSPDEIFSDQTKWRLQNQTQSADSYRGLSIIRAWSGSMNWQPNSQWEMNWGYRLEQARQDVGTFFYFNQNDIQSRGTHSTSDLLPSYTVVWKPNEKIRARAAYGESVARPDFRELSTVRYLDNETGFEAKGNTQLSPAVIQHLDQRWEYYFKEDESISLGLFYKKFLNPIEDVFQPAAGSLIKVPQNALSAENRGFEIETRFSLRRLARSFRRWSVVANYSSIESQVTLDPRTSANLTTRHRPLQGQSPSVLNFQLLYDRPQDGWQGSLLYNVLGPRITEVGTDQRPDIYEQPFHQLDLVLRKQMRGKWSWNFRARNLLDPVLFAKQGPEIVRSTRRGRFFSTGAAWTF